MNPRATFRPLIAGVSAAHKFTSVGTLGFFCRPRQRSGPAGPVFVLSANHTFGRMNRAKPGDPLYQCAPADGGTSRQHFASFTRAVPLLQGPEASNEVDAAIGTLLPRIEFEARILNIGPVAGVGKAECGMRVVKCGSRTAYTEGIITAVEESASVSMSYSGPLNLFHFVRQLRIEPLPPFTRFADAGDSGALVVERETRKGVGLFFASAGGGSYALANHLTTVLDSLDIELITRS